MTARVSALTLSAARALLGVAPDADERELRTAYREAAKRAHPDRPTGDAALFRDVLAAYRLLQDHPFPPTTFPPPVPAALPPGRPQRRPGRGRPLPGVRLRPGHGRRRRGPGHRRPPPAAEAAGRP